MKGKKKKETNNYFYTCDARIDKIYVFWNGYWLNQLMVIGSKYYWMSLNKCGSNWDTSDTFQKSMREAIEGVMNDGHEVYQLDTLDELAEFIESGEK